MAENDSKLKYCLNLIGVLDSIVLIFALMVSLSSTSISPLIIGIVVLIGLLIRIGLCLMYCRKLECTGNELLLNFLSICSRLWCSCVLGLMSSVYISDIHNYVKTAILVSIGIKAFWSICQRYFGLIKYSTSSVTWAEITELVVFFVTRLIVTGLIVTGIIVLPKDQAIFHNENLFFFYLILFSFVVSLRRAPLRYKHPIIIFALIAIVGFFLVCLSNYFQISLDVHSVTLCCFATRLLTDPFFDLLFRKPFVLVSREGLSHTLFF